MPRRKRASKLGVRAAAALLLHGFKEGAGVVTAVTTAHVADKLLVKIGNLFASFPDDAHGLRIACGAARPSHDRDAVLLVIHGRAVLDDRFGLLEHVVVDFGGRAPRFADHVCRGGDDVAP